VGEAAVGEGGRRVWGLQEGGKGVRTGGKWEGGRRERGKAGR
jgi:hypothetical protein